MILGGEPDKSVITFDPATSAYTSGPDMLNDHENFGCAHFNSDAHFGRPVVLAAKILHIKSGNFGLFWKWHMDK